MAKPVNLSDVITSLKKVFAPSVNATVIMPIWEKVVGEKLAQHCRPKSWSGGKLQVVCSSSVWSSVLMSSETLIIERIQKLTKSEIITGLHVVVRHIKKEKKVEKLPRKWLPLTEEMVTKSEELASLVPPEFRESFQRAYITQQRSDVGEIK